jgi:hypothetical protein
MHKMNDKFFEVNEFNLPAKVTVLTQSEEEIKRLEIPEGLSEIDRSKLLLDKKTND